MNDQAAHDASDQPPSFDQLIADSLQRLELPPTALWCVLTTGDDPIDRRALPVRMHVRSPVLPTTFLPLDLGAAWHGYLLTLFGVVADPQAEPQRYLLVDTPAGEVSIRLVYGHVQHAGDALAIEQDWPVRGVVPPRIQGAQPALPPAQWQRLGKGYDLLTTFAAQPPARAAERQAILDAAIRLVAQKYKLTRQVLANELNIARPTLDEWLDRTGLPRVRALQRIPLSELRRQRAALGTVGDSPEIP